MRFFMRDEKTAHMDGDEIKDMNCTFSSIFHEAQHDRINDQYFIIIAVYVPITEVYLRFTLYDNTQLSYKVKDPNLSKTIGRYFEDIAHK